MSIRGWLFAIGLSVGGSVAAQTAPGAAGTPAIREAAPSPVPATPTDDCPSRGHLQQVAIEAVAAMPTVPPDDGALRKAAVPAAEPAVQLRQGISVTIRNLNVLLHYARCVNRNVVLFLDNRQMPDLQPYPQSDPEKNVLFFEMKRTEASRDAWTYLLGKPRFTPRRVEVSVGLVDAYAMPGLEGKPRTILLDVIPTVWLTVWTAVILFFLFCGLRLGKESNMLRDSGPPPANGARKAFSLARVQLATWTFLILASYLFIGLITGDYTTSITESVLALMGISAGTAIGSSIIDNNPSRPPAGTTATAVEVVPATPPATTAGTTARADTAAQPDVIVVPNTAGAAAVAARVAPTAPVRVAVVVRPAPSTTGRWWKDILMDEEGVNFHRFQMAAWTFVLGIIFLRQVYNELAMPEFNPALLALIGISSGTYLGLKITAEKPAVS
jgi:hypothetical protein